jgi:Ser/Thr protein kinase RdoA (MazF antagonist)
MISIDRWTPSNHSIWRIRHDHLPEDSEEYRVVKKDIEAYFPVVGAVRAVARNMREDQSSSTNYQVTGDSEVNVKKITRFTKLEDRRARELATIDTVLSVTDFLIAHGVPTFGYIPSRDGALFTYIENVPFMVSPFIEGHHFQGTLPQLEAFAREFGKIHRVMQHYPSERLRRSDHVELPYDPNLVAELREQNAKALASDPKPMDFIADTLIDLLEERLEGITAAMSSHQFPPAVTLGDLHPHDTIYDGDHLKVIHDFEKVSFGYPRVDELAFSVHRFVRQYIVYSFTEQGRLPTQSDIRQAVDCFLDAYQEEHLISEEERVAIPDFIAKTNAHKAQRLLQYWYALVPEPRVIHESTYESEGRKFTTHLLEADSFRNL